MPHDAEAVNNHTSEASPTSTRGSATCCQSFDHSRHFAFQRCSSRRAGSHQAATQQNGTVGGTNGADRRSRRAPLRGWFAWEDFELVCSVTAGNWLAAFERSVCGEQDAHVVVGNRWFQRARSWPGGAAGEYPSAVRMSSCQDEGWLRRGPGHSCRSARRRLKASLHPPPAFSGLDYPLRCQLDAATREKVSHDAKNFVGNFSQNSSL